MRIATQTLREMRASGRWVRSRMARRFPGASLPAQAGGEPMGLNRFARDDRLHRGVLHRGRGSVGNWLEDSFAAARANRSAYRDASDIIKHHELWRDAPASSPSTNESRFPPWRGRPPETF